MDNITKIIKISIHNFNQDKDISAKILRKANLLYLNGQTMLLSRSKHIFEFDVDDDFADFNVRISVNDDNLHYKCNCKAPEICEHIIATTLHLYDDLIKDDRVVSVEGKAYSKKGMIKRVIDERKQKADKAEYKIRYASNPFGPHILLNEKSQTYEITIRNFNKEVGYCSCLDYQKNKLGTCKHLIFAFDKFSKTRKNNAKKAKYPFIEIYLNPLKDYCISWHYPHEIFGSVLNLIKKYFKTKNHIDNNNIKDFLGFFSEASEFKEILIRPDVYNKVSKAYGTSALNQIQEKQELDFSIVNIPLFPYQEEGIRFSVFKEGSIIADEMGLGKTIQAIAAAIFKKDLFGFKRTIVVCPASVKEQWKNEIEKFTKEKAIVVEGFPHERASIYQNATEYFLITNYESVLRDYGIINKYSPDFLILDEAQKVKNYETRTSGVIDALQRKHTLVITGTPLENKLVDLYTIVKYVDDSLLSPLWEFSYQHCYFDSVSKNKITGYFNLVDLKTRLKDILIRREKREVIKQLPNISQVDVPIKMHPVQADYHSSYAGGVAKILSKKFITPMDMQRLMLLLSKMRMVCDSSYLVDLETNYSPKLIELEFILKEKFDLKNSDRKIIIFSEWKKMNHIIGKMLRDNDIGFVELNGSIPVKKRGKLIKEFEDNSNIKVFLSTEAGGVGLNLQVADTVINFELPWNPAKKNQRIGRIDRLGQKSDNLTVINFITLDSIEMKIASGLVLKQNLFDSLLSESNNSDVVDFSTKGRAQFLTQLQESIGDFMLDDENDIKDEPIAEPSEELREIAQLEDEFKKPQEDNLLHDFEDDLELPIEEINEPHNYSNEEPKEEKTVEKIVNNEQAADQLENVLNQGLGFISGIFQMATGNELTTGKESITVDKKTGEVTMKFKLPGF
jgi:SNF2 family DNA or RNA helicase